MIKQILLLALVATIAYSQCANPAEVEFGDRCWDLDELQSCHYHLDSLSAAPQDNPSISNVCEDFVNDDDKTQYLFTISYNNPYYHNTTCNTQEVSFQGTDLPEGSSSNLNEWEFNGSNQEIQFNILHEDIDGETYNCEKYTNPEEYIWQCQMQLNILLGGEVQLEYNFHIVIVLNREYTNELTVNVVPNRVTGDCCVNELGIETILQFCDNFNCDNYLADGEVVERKQDIFVEHSIVSPEFQYYYLNGLDLTLGPIIPDIIATNGSLLYRYRWHFQSNIAMPGMTIEAVSRISESPVARRRRALQQDVGDDYKVKGTATMTVEEIGQKQQAKLEKEEAVNEVLIGVIAGVAALLFIGIAGGLVYFLKTRQQKGLPEQAAKYEQKNTTSADNTLRSEDSNV